MTEETPIKIVLMEHADGLTVPHYATSGAAGMDIEAAIDKPFTIKPNEHIAVPTGLMMAIPEGFEIQIRPRSGLAFKHGLTVANAPGTIDSDYRGEIKVLLINLGAEEIKITRGMRIAQMVLAPVIRAKLIPTTSLDETDRGIGGFGSTGS